jgi:hypothetical protein
MPRIEGLKCASGTSYAVGVTAVGAKPYVDRDYIFEKEGLPPGLLGKWLINSALSVTCDSTVTAVVMLVA